MQVLLLSSHHLNSQHPVRKSKFATCAVIVYCSFKPFSCFGNNYFVLAVQNTNNNGPVKTGYKPLIFANLYGSCAFHLFKRKAFGVHFLHKRSQFLRRSQTSFVFIK